MKTGVIAIFFLSGVSLYGQPTASVAPDGFYDWGQVRAYFSAGAIFSKDHEDFSQKDVFLSFNLDKTWRYAPHGSWSHLLVNTFLDARLTAIPVSSGQPESTVTSRKAALVQMGVFLPMITTAWSRGGASRNALFIAPLAKLGFQTTTHESNPALSGDLFSFQGYGIRLGHFEDWGLEGVAPELVSYLEVVRGRWANFEAVREGVRTRPYRWGLEGRLKVPGTPLMVGFDANVGAGRDDLRFLFGARFDLGKLLGKLQLPGK